MSATTQHRCMRLLSALHNHDDKSFLECHCQTRDYICFLIYDRNGTVAQPSLVHAFDMFGVTKKGEIGNERKCGTIGKEDHI